MEHFRHILKKFLPIGIVSVFFISLSFFPFIASANDAQFGWAKGIGSTASDGAYSVTTDSSGNVYTTGLFSGSNVDFDPAHPGTCILTSAGLKDIFVSKFDSSGNCVWTKAMGGTGNDVGRDISVDSSGYVYTTGNFNITTDSNGVDFDPGTGTYYLKSNGIADVFVSKLDSSGNFVWAKAIGGVAIDIGESIAVDSTGNVYTTGMFRKTVDFDPGDGIYNLVAVGTTTIYTDIFISKLDSSGNFVWAKSIGGTGNDAGWSMTLDSTGNVYTTGSFNITTDPNGVDFDPGAGTSYLTSTGLNDVFVSKFDSSGNFVWVKAMGGATDNDSADSIAVDSSGNIYTTGIFRSATVDFDPGTGTYYLNSNGGGDIFVSKLNSSGNFVWAKAIGGTGNDMGNSIVVDSIGNVYTTGYFYPTTDPNGVDFDPGTGTYYLKSNGGNDIFISKLDSSGGFVWAKSIGGDDSTATHDDTGFSITLDSNNDVYTAGTFYITVAMPNGVDFDPGTGTYYLNSNGGGDIFILKLTPLTDITTSTLTGLVTPVRGATPIAVGHLATTDTTYAITSLTWTPVNNPFQAVTDYTAHVVLTANTGYKFQAGGLTPIINTGTPTLGTIGEGDVEGNTLSFDVTFPKTASANTGGGMPVGWLYLPKTPLGGFKVTVNGGISTTTSRIITLKFNAGSDVKKMAISMTGDFSDAGQEDYSSTKQLDICSKCGGLIKNPTCPDDQYTIYVKFYTQYGVASNVVLQKINFINVSPSLSSVVSSTLNQNNQVSTSTSIQFTRDLEFGIKGDDVKALQQILISKDTGPRAKALAKNGVTTYFGTLTKQAVIEFQKANNITPALGYFGIKTMAIVGQ